MIFFGSQRGGGADLATHLTNSEDNEFVAWEMHGTIADDLPGGFAEIEAQAHAMTKLKNYLYSLSINPGPNQDWTDEMFADAIARSGAALGLEDQPHAIARHIKEGADGALREHCHVVWSRVDVQNSCGINIAYDRLKLMQVAREMAQEYGFELPSGYDKIEQNHEQTSLYETTKENQTGISKEQHREVVTDLWRTSDGPKAFVAALEQNGYMLASGRRPYVLVDSFGGMHALPRLIDDQQVRTKDVEAFLRSDFPPESLSTVEEARAVAAALDESRERIAFSQKLEEQREILARDQQARCDALQAEIDHKTAMHQAEAASLSERYADELYAQKLTAAQQDLDIQFRRASHAPTGLAAFLSRVTGVDALRAKYHAYQDRKRDTALEQVRIEIEGRREEARLEQERLQGLEMLEMRRKEAEQVKSFEREARSIEMAQTREKAAHYAKGYEHMPSVQLALKPPGRMAVPAKAQKRYYAPTVKDANVKAQTPNQDSAEMSENGPAESDNTLTDEFTAATQYDYSADTSDDSGPEPGHDSDRSRRR